MASCLQPAAFIQPTDDAGVASGLVLRELHAAMLRGIDGRGGLGSVGAEAPRTAKLALSEAQAAVDWTRRVSRVILDSAPFAVDDDARVRSQRHALQKSISLTSLPLHGAALHLNLSSLACCGTMFCASCSTHTL